MSHSLLRALRSPEASERAAACSACVDDPSAVLLLEALCSALGDADKTVVRAASDALVALSERHAEVHGALRSALRSEEPRERWGGAFTSARIAPPQPGLLPVLVEAMQSRDGDVRWAAARIAVDMARLHDEAFRALLGLASAADDVALRRMAIFCLRDLAPDDPAAARVLLEATREDEPHVKRAAFTAIGNLSAPPDEVWSRLIEAVHRDPDPPSRRIAVLAMGQLCQQDPDRFARQGAAELSRVQGETHDGDLVRAVDLALARMARG